MITYAGISSSRADNAAGKNEHFRSFEVEYPPRKRARTDAGPNEDKNENDRGAKTTALGKASLFKPPSGDKRDSPYQKLLRLSPVGQRDSATKRVGAAATGTAEQNEIVIFDATTSTPNASSICTRIVPEGGSEAVDMDITNGPEEDAYDLAFCTDRAVFIYSFKYDFATKKIDPLFGKPSRVLTSKNRFRSIRWLSPKHLLLLINYPMGQAGAELMTLYVDDPTDAAIVTSQTRLPRSIQSGIGLDVSCLDADAATGGRQIVGAVAGKDTSIRIYSLDYDPSNPEPKRQISPPRLFQTLRDVHKVGISKVLLSNFFPPVQPSHSPKSVASQTSYIQLASTSLDGSVVVDWLALTSVPISPVYTSDVPGKQKTPTVRWVLSNSWTELLRSQWVRALLAIAFALVAIYLQYRMFGAGGMGLGSGKGNESLAPLGKLGDYPAAAGGSGGLPPVSVVNMPDEIKNSVFEEGDVEETATYTSTSTTTQTESTEQISPSPRGAHRIREILRRHRPPSGHKNEAEFEQKPIVIRPESEADGFDGSGIAVSVHEAHETEMLEKEHGAKKFDELRGGGEVEEAAGKGGAVECR